MTTYDFAWNWCRAVVLSGLAAGLAANPESTLADYEISPSQSIAVDAIGMSVFPAANGDVGAGEGLTQVHSIVSYLTFDLSEVQGPIAELEITGSLTNLRPVLSQSMTYLSAGQYASLNVGVSLPGFPNLSDFQAIYASVVSGPNVGGFIIDNGVVVPPAPPPTYGANFALQINGAIGSIQGGILALGFSGGQPNPFFPGVTGDLSVQLDVGVVPEPSALTLMALGVGLFGCGWFARSAGR
jgi:hypothetical protein